MKPKEISFSDITHCSTQQTILKVLREYEYDFESVTEYENTMFYCNIYKEVESNWKRILTKLFRIKFNKTKTKISTKLALSTTFYVSFEINTPIVFTREDVQNAVTDAPETYIGNLKL